MINVKITKDKGTKASDYQEKLQSLAFRLIRHEYNDLFFESNISITHDSLQKDLATHKDSILGNYVRGVVEMETEIYKELEDLIEEAEEEENS